MKLYFVSTALLFYFIQTCRASEGEEFCPINQDKCDQETKSLSLVAPKDCYKAAVLEHARADLSNPHDSIEKNLQEYRLAAEEASKHGVEIIVFPEDGLVYGKEEYVLQTIEEIPDPESLEYHDYNPCLSAERTNNILKQLSCIAKDYNLYVVANFGTKETCIPDEPIGDRTCPKSGYLKLNTNVVLDSRGRFIKRYRKYNLYIEVFDKPPTIEFAYFDSPMGRIGMFTCFDMIFKHPAVDLVEQFNVDTIIFPTLWYDELPLLSAVQYQDAWSYKMNVSLLAANIFNPELGTIGSGIYAEEEFIHTGADTAKSTLLIASVPKHASKQANCMRANQKLEIELGPDHFDREYKHGNYKLIESDRIVLLNENEASKTVCNGRVCCTLDYKLSAPNPTPDSLAFIVRDSTRPGRFNWHEQVCAFATLKSPVKDVKMLGTIRFSDHGLVSFERLSIIGTFNSKYVFPVAAFNVTDLIPRTDRKYECSLSNDKSPDEQHTCKFSFTGKPDDGKIYSFGLYGRLYDEDKL